MKIGILTYHCIPNFGAQLQALSTIGYLKNHGYEPVVLNWYPQDLEDFYHKRAPECQNDCQFQFSQENMPVSKLCRTLEELCDEIVRLKLDGIFLGSDALFDFTPKRLRYNYSIRKLKRIPIYVTSNHRLPNPFWGCYNDYLTRPLPTVGFSISSQNAQYQNLNKKENRELRRLLSGFKGLTVRDKWTQSMVKKITGDRLPSITPDPVFSFNQNVSCTVSKEEICAKYNLPQNYILISFLYPFLSDEFVKQIIKLVEAKTGAECVSFPMPDKLRKFDTKHAIELPLNPIDWYYLIKYSRGYIGERMHPIVVALHNSVPFFCFDQYGSESIIIPRIWSKFNKESSKIYDLLKKAGFEKNTCFYKSLGNLQPQDVVERFLSFDEVKANEFSLKMYYEYRDAMNTLVKEF